MASFEELDELSRATRRLARHRDELSKLEGLRDADIERTNRWYEDASAGEKAEVLRLINEVEAWARAHRTDRDKSWTTPNGKVSTRVQKGSVVVTDPEAFRVWCEANGAMREPKPPEPDITVVRQTAEAVVDGRLIVEGEIVPGVEVQGVDDIKVSVS